MSAGRIIWVCWCLLWSFVWGMGTIDVAGTNSVAWQLQQGSNQGLAVFAGIVLTGGSAALALVGRSSKSRASARLAAILAALRQQR